MTIKVKVTTQHEVEREISLPYFFRSWPMDSFFKVIDENTVICIDTMPTFNSVRVTDLNSSIKGYMQHEKATEITEDRFNAELLTAQHRIGAITGQPFVEALRHLKEAAYTACTYTDSGTLDAPLAFLKQYEHLLEEPKPAEPVEVLNLDDLPF